MKPVKCRVVVSCVAAAAVVAALLTSGAWSNPGWRQALHRPSVKCDELKKALGAFMGSLGQEMAMNPKFTTGYRTLMLDAHMDYASLCLQPALPNFGMLR